MNKMKFLIWKMKVCVAESLFTYKVSKGIVKIYFITSEEAEHWDVEEPTKADITDEKGIRISNPVEVVREMTEEESAEDPVSTEMVW